MQKPKVNDHYKIFDSHGVKASNVMKIISVKGSVAKYVVLSEDDYFEQTWDFIEYPECLNYKLTSLELELL